MEQEIQFLKKRLVDLSRRSEEKNIVTFSNFLNINELNILHQITKELYSSFQVFGGYDHAERQMVAFIPDALYYAWEYPMDTVRIVPASPKFAEALTHRDVLGALMNLGIKREMTGDLLMTEKETIVFCVDSVTEYIVENCGKIRHTPVKCMKIPPGEFHYEPKFVEKEGIVSSLRLDTIIADVCKLPRSAAQKKISEGDAFINARKIQENGYICQNRDVLSVRHVGKFRIETTDKVTKKGRIKYRYQVYS